MELLLVYLGLMVVSSHFQKGIDAQLEDPNWRHFLQDYGEFYKYEKFATFVDRNYYQSVRLHTLASHLMISISKLENMEETFEEEVIRVQYSSSMTGTVLVVIFTDSPRYWLEKISNKKLFSSLPWLVIGRMVTSGFLKLRLPLDNLVVFGNIYSTSKEVEVIFQEIYTVTDRTPVSHSVTGYWSSSRGLKGPGKDNTNRRMDLLGARLICATEEQTPHIMMEQRADGSWEVYGWAYDLQRTIEKMLNFTCHNVPSPDRQYGSVDANGAWSGVVGMVYSGKADLITAPLDNTMERSTVVKFLVAIDLAGYIMVVKQVSQLGSVWTNYTTEFSYDIWLCIVMMVVVGSSVYYFISRTLAREKLKLRVEEAVMMSLGAVTSQSQPNTLSSISGRIAQITTIFASLLITIHYSCWLYSSLTVSNNNFPFDSFQSLLDDGTYKLGLEKGTSIETEIKKSKDSTIHTVWNELVDPAGLVDSSSMGLEKALTDNFAYLVIDSEFYGLVDDACDFMVIPWKYFRFPAGFAVAHDSPLEHVLNRAILMTIDSGVLVRIKLQWDKGRPDCSAVDINPMTLKQTVSAFLFLGTGIALSVFVVCLERLFAMRRRKMAITEKGIEILKM